MKKLLLLLVLACCVGTASATDYYLGGTFTASNTWSISGQLTDEDNDGTYSIFVELPVGYDLFFTIFTQNSVDWSTSGGTVLRPKSSKNPWITNSVQTIDLSGTTDNGAIRYPTTNTSDANKNFARALKIDFTESTKTLSVTRFIVVASGHNGWSTTTDYIPETTFGSKVYSGDVIQEAESASYDDGFKFVYLYEGEEKFGGKKDDSYGSWLDPSGSNATVDADGVYTLKAQFTDWEWQDPVRVNKTASVTALGMGTFSSEYALDFTGITAIKAYIIDGETAGQLNKTQVTDKVKAGTGLFIESADGKAANVDVPTTIYTTDPGTNWLKAVTATTKIYQTDGGNTNYILTTNEGASATPKFFKVNTAGNEVGAGKAYLQVPGTTPANEFFWFADDTKEEEEVTAINAIANTVDSNAAMFNLAGQRVNNNYKGVVVKNGKKFIVK